MIVRPKEFLKIIKDYLEYLEPYLNFPAKTYLQNLNDDIDAMRQVNTGRGGDFIIDFFICSIINDLATICVLKYYSEDAYNTMLNERKKASVASSVYFSALKSTFINRTE